MPPTPKAYRYKLASVALLALAACLYAKPEATAPEGSPADCRKRCEKYKPEHVSWVAFYFKGETADRAKYKRCKQLCRR